MWEYLPEDVLLHVLSYLKAKELTICKKVCVRWNHLCMDEMLWKRLLYRDFHIDKSIDKPPDTLWRTEYVQLVDSVPVVPTEKLEVHTDQVLHVSFAHDGSMFATASKDGSVVVWDANVFPCKKKYRQDMLLFSWKYPQFTQFNSTDTLLLVSGVHFGSMYNTSGEIAVFSLHNEFTLQCRVANKPVDTFGCWIGDDHLISSELHWLAHLTTLSLLWINRASQAPESEHIPVIKQLYRLYNCNASIVRSIMIANCKVRNKTSKDKTEQAVEPMATPDTDKLSISYSSQYYHRSPKNNDSGIETAECSERETNSDVASEESSESSEQDFLDGKLLIYSHGTDTYIPHKVSFKYIENVHFPKQLKPGPPIQERLAARQRQRESASEDGPDWTDYGSVRHMFDEPDHSIDVRGHIVGMALSPDHRYLYINVQIWPPDHAFDTPMHSPPLSKLLHMHVVDLDTLSLVGHLARPDCQYLHAGHYIFLDVSEHFVASGAEGAAAYVWSRHYGAALAELRHADAVNAAAFSRTAPLLVTVSDDFAVQVWRSRCEVRRLGLRDRFDTSRAHLVHRERPCRRCDAVVQ